MVRKGKTYLALSLVLSMIVLLLAACSGGDGSANPADATKKDGTSSNGAMEITMYGGSPGGFFTLAGEGVGNLIRKNIPNSQFNYEPGNPLANIVNMSAGKNPMGLGLAFNLEIKAGLSGVAPFKEKVPEVLALGALYNNAKYQLIVSKDFADKYGVKSIEDIAAKKAPLRIAVLQRGNLVENVNRAILESYGITYADLEKWGGKVYFENIATAADMMKNNKLDAYGASPFAPDSKVLELATSKQLVLFGLNEKAQNVLAEQFSTPKAVIPAKSYEWQTEDVPTVSTSLIVMASKSMSDDVAYQITKTLVENIETLQGLSPSMKSLTPQIMAEVAPAKLHPGAEKYYREKGIIK